MGTAKFLVFLALLFILATPFSEAQKNNTGLKMEIMDSLESFMFKISCFLTPDNNSKLQLLENRKALIDAKIETEYRNFTELATKRKQKYFMAERIALENQINKLMNKNGQRYNNLTDMPESTIRVRIRSGAPKNYGNFSIRYSVVSSHIEIGSK